MKMTFIYIFLLCLILSFTTGCSSESQELVNATPIITPTPESNTPSAATPEATIEPTAIPPVKLIIGATGDIMCHDLQMEDASYTAAVKNKGEDYDFDHVFKYIKAALEYPDLTIGNLETVFAGEDEVYTGFPYFNSPDEFFYSIVDAGYDVLTNANNHSYDRGATGVRRTIELMEENGIYHTGTYSTPEDREKPLIIEVKGVKIGILSNTYGIQHSRVVSKEDQEYMLSIATKEHIEEQVQMLKDADADIIIASAHWGKEEFLEPIDEQLETANLMSELGVDIIFGHHTHTLQPIEMISTTMEDGSKHNTLVCWSLGNFIANTFLDNCKRGGIAYAYLTFYPDTGEVSIDKCEFLPTFIYNDYSRYTDYHVLPAGLTADEIQIDDIDIPSDFNSDLEDIYNESTAAIGDSYAVPIRFIPTD